MLISLHVEMSKKPKNISPDITYSKLNSQQKSKQNQLSPEGRAILKMFLKSDYILYEHFKKQFNETIMRYW